NQNKSLLVSDYCNLFKYKLYTIEMMRYAYRDHNDYKKAFDYYTMYDELFTQLKSDEYINKLKQIEKQFESEKKEQQLIIKDQTIKANNRLILLLIAGLVLLIMLAIVFLLYSIKTKQREQNKNTLAFTRQLLESIEDERRRIAADLHDSVGNELLSLKSVYQNRENSIEKIDNIINDIRIIGRNLSPVMFDKVGLKVSLEQLAERIQSQNNFLLTAEINYNKSLSSKSELQVYRIIQEAVNNMIKHSKASAGKIELNETDTQVLMEIKDSGIGFNTNAKINNTKSFGLLNMIERSKTINGKLTIDSTEKGTVITIEIPKENL
ncbi:MAG: hypothetical protein IT236_02990, partial [Bacteroidia bacterium]|nr:hypothetical protein [Bacteroidia bacterium]